MRAKFQCLSAVRVLAATLTSAVALAQDAPPTQPSNQPSTQPSNQPSTQPTTQPGAPAPSTTVAPAPAPTPTPAQDSAAVDRRERARATAEDALRKSVIAQPMERARFIAFLTAIDSALATDAKLSEAHAAYLATIAKASENSTKQIVRLLPAAYTFDPAREAFFPRDTPELIALLALRDKSQRSALAAEQTLLDAIESATAPDRKSRYRAQLVAWQLERLPREALLPSTRVTLFELLPKLHLGTDTLHLIDATLNDYATTLATALAARAQLLRDNDTARAIIETNAGIMWRFAPGDAAATTEAQLAALDDKDFASELAIRGMHFTALSRIRSRLQPQDGRRLVERWQRELHPELFEDERLLARIVEDTLALPAFNSDQDSALLDQLDTVYQRLEPLSRAACEAADLVLPRLANHSKEAVIAEIDARIGVIDCQRKRRVSLKDALLRVRGMLGDADPAMSARITDVVYTIDSLDRADSFERNALAARKDSLAADDAAIAPPNSERGAKNAPAASTPTAPGGAPTPAAPAASPGGNPTDSSTTTTDTTARTNRNGRGSRRNGGN